jgi:adenine deaminase
MNIVETRLQHYEELLSVARGDLPADTILRGGRFLNVMTGEILRGDIAIHKGFLVSLFAKNMKGVQEIDASRKIAIPAFIDPHVHIESSMCLPPRYAEIAAANGTGTVFADPHEIVNVMGVDGFELMAGNVAGLPLRLFFDIPTCVPSKREAESSGADIRSAEVKEMAQRGGRKLGELMSYEEIISGEPVMSDIVKTGWKLGLPRDAHFPMIDALGSIFTSLNPGQMIGVLAGMIGAKIPGLRGLNALPYHILVAQLRKKEYRDLAAYLSALGPTADHETYGPEIQIKLDHGMRLMISSHIFTLRQMMPLFLQGVKEQRYKDTIGLCTDDIWPDELVEKGGMVGVLRALVKQGIDPVDAVRFATFNNAQRLAMAGIAEAALIGALAPGMVADLVLLAEPLKKFKIDLVLHEGLVVARNGKVIRQAPAAAISKKALDTVKVSIVTGSMFRLPVPGTQAETVLTRVLSLPKPPALPFPTLVEELVTLKDGVLDTNEYITIAVFNRYGNNGKSPVLGLIKGYTLKEGAVASTLAHDSHNLIVLGRNPSDMALAANTVLETNGGMAAVKNGNILASIALPVGGLMSNVPIEEIAESARAFRQAIGALGLDPASPILPFAVFSLPAAPGAKVTDRGIWDADNKALVSLFPARV